MTTVLFVDDERAVLDALRFAMFRAPFRPIFACGARAALDELARAPVDAVVTDLIMPEMDGVALLERVRETQPAAIRIILSGNVEKTLHERARQVVHEVLSKPCPAADLRACLTRWLASPR